MVYFLAYFAGSVYVCRVMLLLSLRYATMPLMPLERVTPLPSRHIIS